MAREVHRHLGRQEQPWTKLMIPDLQGPEWPIADLLPSAMSRDKEREEGAIWAEASGRMSAQEGPERQPSGIGKHRETQLD